MERLKNEAGALRAPARRLYHGLSAVVVTTCPTFTF
jgi:hypothetical protein